MVSRLGIKNRQSDVARVERSETRDADVETTTVPEMLAEVGRSDEASPHRIEGPVKGARVNIRLKPIFTPSPSYSAFEHLRPHSFVERGNGATATDD